jgi:hypothetical protein
MSPPAWPILSITGRRGTADYEVIGFDPAKVAPRWRLAICRDIATGKRFRWPIRDLRGLTEVETAYLASLAANQQEALPCPCPECGIHDGIRRSR